MTDFAIIYRDAQREIWFIGEGVWRRQECVGYEIRVPSELATVDDSMIREEIWEAVRMYVLNRDPSDFFFLNPNISMPKYSDAWLQWRKE